jgi:hypothetical protein
LLTGTLLQAKVIRRRVRRGTRRRRRRRRRGRGRKRLRERGSGRGSGRERGGGSGRGRKNGRRTQRRIRTQKEKEKADVTRESEGSEGGGTSPRCPTERETERDRTRINRPLTAPGGDGWAAATRRQFLQAA